MAKKQDRVVPLPYLFHQGEVISDVAEHGFIEYYYPKDGLNADVLDFTIEGNSEQLIHPNFTYIKIKGVLSGLADTKDNSTNPASEKTVKNGKASYGVVNNFLGSLIDSVDVYLNNVLVTMTDRSYPYVSYLNQLLNYGREAKGTTMRLVGWSSDVGGKMEDMTAEGFRSRKAFFNGKQQIELIGKISSPLFNQSKLLPTMVSMRVVLRKNRERFFLMHEKGDFSFKYLEATLMVQKTVAVPAVREAVLRMLDEGKPAVYPVRHMKVQHISIGAGMSEKTIDNLFLGKVPCRIVIGMVETQAYLGDHNKNPYNFQHFDLAEICLYKDGSPYPRPMIKMNIDDGQYAEAYHHTMTSLKASYNRNVPGLTMDEFAAGYTLFSYDMSPDQMGSTHPGSNMNMNSNIRLELKFHNPLPIGISLLVYHEMRGTIEIHKNRQVVADV